ncbi:YdeI/OmpD-associated family protein [Sinomicrobium kalidii]|uniref:YdeI/OmpD-associated family protein n=1 Tax=Sinomicrobium kalidii TaxID=2900738 RepID=UPI001E3CC3D5|nr:YdeI/OmpD-associated family protein [Sinomicrobium kalidii]UGU16766.1 YdeI/OmpD-associated family protein [Sinomicrobium kalidii]
MINLPTESFYPANGQQWRAWLQENHDKEQSVWLIRYKKKSGIPTISWSDAVDEALCFGWIDSKAKPIDDEKYMQFFSRRKAVSTWSKVNKEKVQKLIEEGRMTEAGLKSIAVAKQNGSWTILDTVEALIIPDDLEEAFRTSPGSKDFFLGLSKSVKKHILQWLVLAKREATRQKRIREIVESAGQKLKPGPLR